jgi:hypothetical protein
VITVGCCVGDHDRLGKHVLPWLGGRPLIGAYNQTGIAVAYNAVLRAFAGSTHPLLLVHDHLEITDERWADKVMTAFEDPTVGIVGVAGGQSTVGAAWWEATPVGRQQIDTGLIDFGTREGDVDCLEGSFLAIRGALVAAGLRFDESYAGFHGYDVDIAMTVTRRLGLRARVIDLDTHHHTVLGFRDEASARDWRAADVRFRRKWL